LYLGLSLLKFACYMIYLLSLYHPLYSEQCLQMHQQALLSPTFMQRKFSFGSFRVLAVTHTSRHGFWKHRRTMLSLMTPGLGSIPHSTRTPCL